MTTKHTERRSSAGDDASPGLGDASPRRDDGCYGGATYRQIDDFRDLRL
ncbi:hypothetical protein [Halochromatium roseum]|nr:hypothetical protein [Halochromatium roseum]